MRMGRVESSGRPMPDVDPLKIYLLYKVLECLKNSRPHSVKLGRIPAKYAAVKYMVLAEQQLEQVVADILAVSNG